MSPALYHDSSKAGRSPNELITAIPSLLHENAWQSPKSRVSKFARFYEPAGTTKLPKRALPEEYETQKIGYLFTVGLNMSKTP